MGKRSFILDNTPSEWYIIIHNTQWQRYNLDSLMLKAVYDGKIHNSVYINILDRQSDNNKSKPILYHSTMWWKINGKNYIDLPNTEKNDSINKKRRNVFYHSIEHQIEKIKFLATNPELPFMFGYFGPSVINDMPQEIVESIAIDMIKILETR